MKLRKVLVLVVIFLMIYILGVAYINSHEFIHKQIFSRYETKSQININYLTLSGSTIPENYLLCDTYCKLSHSLNDTFGYYLVIFIMNSWALLLALLLAYFLLKKNGNN